MSWKVSDNLWSWEIDCTCGCGLGETHGALHPALIDGFEYIRAQIGKPLSINSGFRCYKKNKSVDGSPTSQHLWGRALDIRLPEGVDAEYLAQLAEGFEAFKNGGIGKYNTFLHVDVRPNGPARWDLRT